MKDKLAEEILDKIELKDICIGEFYYRDEVIEAMQVYHEAKLREALERGNQYVTDEDIEAYADGLARAESKKDFERGEWLGIKEGARAMRDGEIKPVSRDNDC